MEEVSRTHKMKQGQTNRNLNTIDPDHHLTVWSVFKVAAVCLLPSFRRILENWNCCVVPAFGEAHQWAQAHFFVAEEFAGWAAR
jgi:hypothetical protein